MTVLVGNVLTETNSHLPRPTPCLGSHLICGLGVAQPNGGLGSGTARKFGRQTSFHPRMSFHSTCAFLGLLLSSFPIGAADAPPALTLARITQPIVSSPFQDPTPPVRKGALQGWQAAIGRWWVADGALHGDEVAEDNHASSCTYRIDARGLVITAEFRLGTAGHVAFGCRDTIAPHHHLARTFISRDAVWITRMSGIAKTTKSEKLVELKTPMDPEVWHRVTIEIIGDHYHTTVDGHVVEARHPRFADAKGLVALITKGQGAQFRNVRLNHAEPK